MVLASPGVNQGREYNGDGDGDVPMEDADPYNKPKYAQRANHQQRNSQHFIEQEKSAAAIRYSPMNLSPTSPYGATAQQPQSSYTSFTPQSAQSSRQSPTRTNPYMSPPQSYYSPPGMHHRKHWLFLFLNLMCVSLSTSCPSAPSHTVEHEPRELLSTISNRTAQRSL
jgi:dual specificity protein kinase YAK1